MLKDLEEPVFAQLFTAEWENNYGESLSSVIVATLQDYFQDVKVWLPDYFYCKFVKEVLFTLTGLYVMQVSTLDLGSDPSLGHLSPNSTLLVHLLLLPPAMILFTIVTTIRLLQWVWSL